MKIKRLVLSAVILGLLVWGFSELFRWIIVDLFGSETLSRIAPALAGASLGIIISALRQKREQLLKNKTEAM